MGNNELPKRSNASVLVSLFFTVLVDMLGVGIVIVVMAPFIKDSPDLFKTTVSQDYRNTIYLSLIALFGAAQFLGAPMLGGLSDKYGRKKIVIQSMLGGAFGYAVFAFGVVKGVLPLLFIGRFITGFFSGSVSILYSIIADLSTPENKAKNFGIIGSAFSFGFIVGPVIGAYLADPQFVSWFNDSTPFFTAMVLSLLSALLIFFFVPETYKVDRTEMIKINPLEGFQNIKKAFTIPDIAPILFILFLIYFGFTFFTQFSSVYLLDALHFTEKQLGHFFGFVGIVLLINQSIVIQFVTNYFSSKQIIRVVLLTLSMGLLIFLIPNNYNEVFLIAAIIPTSFGLLQPNMLTIISNSASKDIQGQILGIQQSVRSLGFAIPPLVAAQLSTIDVRLPNIVGSIIVFIAWLVFLNYYKHFKS